MTLAKSLPGRPSQESLRKDAKKLARDIAAGDAAAIARARAQLPNTEMPLSQRDAQLVLAREYGYSGWQDLCAEVRRRLGKGPEWAAVEAESAIHRNDVERLRQLIAEYPALLSWRREDGRVFLHATTAYANDVSDPAREQTFYRPQCAELLIDSGALIEPSVWEGVIGTGASGMLQVLQRKGVLPPTLPVLAALGDLEGVRRCFSESGALRDEARSGAAADAVTIVNEAFMNACRFKRKAVAAWLLDRCIALDPDLGAQIDSWKDRAAFVEYMFEHYIGVRPATPWRTFVMRQLLHAIDADDPPAFSRWIQSQPWLLEEGCVPLQVDLIERAVLMNREALLTQLIAQDPAVLHSRTPPKSTAIQLAFDDGNAHLIPQLTRIWPLPEFLLGHGANINTTWNTHEPASVLHLAAMNGDYELARFLIDRGIDMTIRDHRWGGTAEGWAYNVGKDPGMHEFLATAERERGNDRRLGESPLE